MAEIYTVCSYKGGVAKTTTAIHLAAYLNTLGRTLLIDGDPNLSALDWNDAGALPFPVMTEADAGKTTEKFDFVVLDTAGRPTPDYLDVIAKQSDLIVVPTMPEAGVIRTLARAIRALRGPAAAKIRILLTIVPPPPARDADMAREVLSSVGLRVMATEIPQLKAFWKASAAGVVVSEADNRQAGRAWEAYRAMGEELRNGRADTKGE